METKTGKSALLLWAEYKEIIIGSDKYPIGYVIGHTELVVKDEQDPMQFAGLVKTHSINAVKAIREMDDLIGTNEETDYQSIPNLETVLTANTLIFPIRNYNKSLFFYSIADTVGNCVKQAIDYLNTL